ncbi:MAG: DUF308 domain-containing protein [Alistipes sp.]|nr:DUF308 domain-containing protein [Alistipes sp.]
MATLISAIDKYRNAIKYWWVSLALGILMFIIGIVVFMHPGESYTVLSIVFGLLILLSGITQLFIGINMPRNTGRGWLIASGIIEIVLGLILSFNIAVSALVLPFFLAFWLLFRGMTVIGTAMEMKHEGIKGTGWAIFWAILLIVCAFVVMIYPALGVGAIVIWLGLAFMFAGISLAFIAFQLNGMRRHLDARV